MEQQSVTLTPLRSRGLIDARLPVSGGTLDQNEEGNDSDVAQVTRSGTNNANHADGREFDNPEGVFFASRGPQTGG